MWSRVAVLVSLGLLSIGAGLASSRPGAHERTVQTVPIGPDSQVRVRATVGHITVLGWDRDQLHVDIERHAPAAVALTRLAATVVASANGREVTISAAQDAGTDPALEATVIIHAPRHTCFAAIDLFEGGVTLKDLHGPITATVTRGGITATALDGPTRLETTMGDIDVEASEPVRRPLHLRAFNGNLRLHLPAAPRDARILALSLSGEIVSAVSLVQKAAFGPRSAGAIFGTGEPVIALDTVNGDIHIDSEGPRAEQH